MTFSLGVAQKEIFADLPLLTDPQLLHLLNGEYCRVLGKLAGNPQLIEPEKHQFPLGHRTCSFQPSVVCSIISSCCG